MSKIIPQFFLFFRPKDYAHKELEDYRGAERTGYSQEECASQFKKCPISLFDVVPVEHFHILNIL